LLSSQLKDLTMPRVSATPGVTIVPGNSITSPFHLSFKHPLLRHLPESRQRVKRSIETTDGVTAKDLAAKLSEILRNPDVWHKLPAGTPKILERLWSQPYFEEEVSRFTEPEKWYIHRTPGAKSMRIHEHEKLTKKLHERNVTLETDNAVLHAKLAGREALLRKLGQSTDYKPKLLIQAIKDFLSDDKKLSGIKTGVREKKRIRIWLDRFGRNMPVGAMVHEVQPESVIEHLAECECGKFATKRSPQKPKHYTVERIGQKICAMLSHQTGGLFRKAPVVQWMRHQLENDKKPPVYWLDQNDIDKLLASLNKLYPQCWAWIAALQWAGGFRPEELMSLQTKNIIEGPEETRILVTEIVDGTTVLWKPKTKRSYGKVHIPKFSLKALQNLANAGGFLLFPNDDKVHGGTATKWNLQIRRKREHPNGMSRYSEFQKANKMWSPAAFTEQYRIRLRAAAKDAKLDWKRVDSRTLRRSCGKRVLLATNYNLEHTAAILRDLPQTVRAHYADLLPEDVKQPE
jgi:integrase